MRGNGVRERSVPTRFIALYNIRKVFPRMLQSRQFRKKIALQTVRSEIVFSSEQEQQFQAEGYVLLGKVLSEPGLAEAQSLLDRMIGQLHPDLQPDEIYSAHQSESWLMELVSAPALLDIVEKVVGPNIVVWSTHLICKPPQTGRAIPWHQDATYWNIAGKMTSIWLALDDVDDDNGTMYVLPSYHAGDPLPRRETADDLFAEEIDPTALPKDVDQLQVGYFLKAGEAGMHHVMIPHRSPVNGSHNRWRRVLVVRYMSADGDMTPQQYPDYRTNEIFDRKFILVRGEDVLGRGLEQYQPN